MPQLYDAIGVGYAGHRRPDPRFAEPILRALGDAESVVNVGAGTGSYEPSDRPVVAVEPSRTMLRQRRAGSAPVVRAVGSRLPFRDDAFAASLAILTLHHWPERERGLRELARVARSRVVLLSFDPEAADFWLVDDYFPGIRELDLCTMPTLDELRRATGELEIEPVPVPHDCRDGFLGAFWRRPEAYLDPQVRGAMSVFARIEGVDSGVERLRRDLEDGSWERRHGDLRTRTEIDLGYRLVVARQDGATGAP